MNKVPLSNLSVLVVEDEYLLAIELRDYLSGAGALVIGPVGTIEEALALQELSKIDVAILDANLQGEMVFPIAEKLEDENVPFLFTTGYDLSINPARFRHVARFGKPINMAKLCEAIAEMTTAARSL